MVETQQAEGREARKSKVDEFFEKMGRDCPLTEEEEIWQRILNKVAAKYSRSLSRDESTSLSYEAMCRERAELSPANVKAAARLAHLHDVRGRDRRPQLRSRRDELIHDESGRGRVIFLPEYPVEPSTYHQGFNRVEDEDLIEAMARQDPLCGMFWRLLYKGHTFEEIRDVLDMSERTFRRLKTEAIDLALSYM